LQFWQGIQDSRCIVWRQAHRAEAYVRLGIELDVFVADDLEAKLPNSHSKVGDDLIKATAAIAHGQGSRKKCREGCQGVELPLGCGSSSLVHFLCRASVLSLAQLRQTACPDLVKLRFCLLLVEEGSHFFFASAYASWRALSTRLSTGKAFSPLLSLLASALTVGCTFPLSQAEFK
jgi:hypothetical protein